MAMPKVTEALEDAKHEARCMCLDLDDALGKKNLKEVAGHLNDAIRRHEAIARSLRAALTDVSHRSCVLSMVYPANLGGGHGPDRAA